MSYQKTCTCELKNNTSQSMMLQTRELPHGEWSKVGSHEQLPPNVLGPNKSWLWGSQSNGLWTGTAGILTYRCDDGSKFELKWENPFCGDNEATMLPARAGNLSCTTTITQGSHASVVFTLEEKLEKPASPTPVSQGPTQTDSGTIVAPTGQTTPASPALPCMIPAQGWYVFRAIEASAARNEDGTVMDAFASATCKPEDRIAFYLPSTEQPENRVHVFYSPFAVDNALATHAGRAASEAAGWILVALNTDPESDPTQITAELICNHLKVHGWKRRTIDRLRFSAHSRGILKLYTNVNAGNLVSAKPTGDVFDLAKVERVVSLDASHLNMPVGSALALFPAEIGFAFRATANTSWTAGGRTVDLFTNAGTLLRTLLAIRCLTDAPRLRPTRTIDPDVMSVVSMMDLPPIGSLSSYNYMDYITKLGGILADPAIVAMTPTMNSARIEKEAWETTDPHFVHNFFAADFFHEVTSDTAPKLG